MKSAKNKGKTRAELEEEILQLQHDLTATAEGLRLLVAQSRLYAEDPVLYYALYYWIEWATTAVDKSRAAMPILPNA